jgi:hypothetical protein
MFAKLVLFCYSDTSLIQNAVFLNEAIDKNFVWLSTEIFVLVLVVLQQLYKMLTWLENWHLEANITLF